MRTATWPRLSGYPSSPGTSIWEGITSRISSSDTRELWDDAPRIDLRPESWTTCQCDERMPIEKTYSEARQHLAALLDRVVEDRETIIIRRRNGARVALLPADELASYEEMAHLLRSPANAHRLLDALRESLADEVV